MVGESLFLKLMGCMAAEGLSLTPSRAIGVRPTVKIDLQARKRRDVNEIKRPT